MLRRTILPRASPTTSYNHFASMGVIKADERQRLALQHVERVYDDMVRYTNNGSSNPARQVQVEPPKHQGLTNIGSLRINAFKKAQQATGASAVIHPLSEVKGLYLYGGVGCGKTYLMDILFNEAPITKKQRVHFHQFMLETHKAIHDIKKTGKPLDGDMLMHETAVRMCGSAELLCFDEVVINDVADAMIMKRLFNAMYKIGLCAVFTSNRPPSDLYNGGLNRESFLPFIDMVTQRCVVHNMASSTDYRLTGTNAHTYMFPFNADARQQFENQWLALTKGQRAKHRTLRVFGRDVEVNKAIGGMARFLFQDLCTSAMSAADYGVIARTFHTVFLENIPRFAPTMQDAKRRFILMIDEFYQYKVKVVVLAEAPPHDLEVPPEAIEGKVRDWNEESFYAGQLIDSGEDVFQMQRCVSRLMEMQSEEYLRSPHLGNGGEPALTDGMHDPRISV